MQMVREDMLTTRNFTATANKESLATRREMETLNGPLNMYVGYVDDI